MMTPTIQLPIRFPKDVKAWIEEQAKLNGSSQNGEVIRVIRDRMNMQGRILVDHDNDEFVIGGQIVTVSELGEAARDLGYILEKEPSKSGEDQ